MEDCKMSPSVQCVINPEKNIDIVSTHDHYLAAMMDKYSWRNLSC